ncbi:hypothetical protein DFH08DRAFT_936988, partial [Mycena albidolilacea]
MTDPSHRSVDRAFLLVWGVEYIAYTLDIALWGIAVVLVLQYFRTYSKKDPILTRAVVAALLFFATIHVLFLSMNDFKDFILLFGDFEGQDVIFYESNVMICAVFVVAFVSQLYYATRIWVLSKRNWRYVTPVVLLALLQICERTFGYEAKCDAVLRFLAFGIGQTVEVAKVHRYSKLESTVITSTGQGAATAACDVTITAILCYILRKARTGVRRTDSALDKMIIYAFNRGVLTSFFALLQLIFFIAMPNTLMFAVFLLPSCHIYVISVCSMLTSRETLRAEMRGPDGVISTFAMSNVESTSARNNHNNLPDDSARVHVVSIISHPLSASTELNPRQETSVVKWVDDLAEDEGSDNRKASLPQSDFDMSGIGGPIETIPQMEE